MSNSWELLKNLSWFDMTHFITSSVAWTLVERKVTVRTEI